MTKVKPASDNDFIRFFGAKPLWGAYAWKYEVDGEIIGLGGIRVAPGDRTVFLNVKEGHGLSKRAIYEAICAGMQEILSLKKTSLKAERNPEFKSALRLLAKMGFRYSHNENEKEIFIRIGV